ncbi:MAG: DUF2202 domain-containing protein [Vicinamibacterales bacterium]
MKRRARLSAVLMTALAIAACDERRSPTSATPATLDPAVVALLTRAIQDEYRAEATYQGVIDDFGAVLPFVNVLTAEERHSAAIGRLFTSRGLAAPVSTSTPASVAHFASVTAACAAGVDAERLNIAMYDDLLRADLPADVRQVFSNNRSASLVNHLPAFERCA